MISNVRPFATPPIPGQPPAQPAAVATPASAAQPPVVATPPPAPSGPAPTSAPPAPPAPPPSYWASNGRSFATLPEIGQAITAGQLPMGKNGVDVQRIGFQDTAAQQAAHKANAARYFKNSLIVGMGGALAGTFFPPLALAGAVLGAWNTWKAFEEFQKSSQAAPPQYNVVEEGRVRPSGSGFYNYEAVDNDSYWNVVPSHPFGFKPGVPLDQVK